MKVQVVVQILRDRIENNLRVNSRLSSPNLNPTYYGIEDNLFSKESVGRWVYA